MNLFERLVRFVTGDRTPTEVPPRRPQPSSEAPRPTVPDASADPYFASVPPSRARVVKPPSKGPLGYDAGAYLPISREEIKDAANGTNLFGNPWFGRRDLIPPADDPRTNLIDRAMVTHGLLSPEQLREIHDVGARMDQIKPSLAAIEHKAALEGDAAIQADREARTRLKQFKKAEAAERKRRRADAIAHRHATDILFLGRGVSKGLADRRSDFAKLQSFGLPALSTPDELATILGLPISRLRWLAFHAEVSSRVHYVQFTVPKKSGGVRT